jgi:hypothetical protein
MSDEKLRKLNEQVNAQEEKFDRALAAGMTGAPLVQIDRKLTRLMWERDGREIELSNEAEKRRQA